MYKDKDKQREANKERQRRYKDRQKALPEQGVTSQKALLSEGVTQGVTVWESEPGAAKAIEEILKGKPERTALGNIRVSKPGDDDYEREDAAKPKRNCKYCGKLLNHSVLVCCYECAVNRNSPGLSRTSSTKGARL